jgi:hypothetical protein
MAVNMADFSTLGDLPAFLSWVGQGTRKLFNPKPVRSKIGEAPILDFFIGTFVLIGLFALVITEWYLAPS